MCNYAPVARVLRGDTQTLTGWWHSALVYKLVDYNAKVTEWKQTRGRVLCCLVCLPTSATLSDPAIVDVLPAVSSLRMKQWGCCGGAMQSLIPI